MTELLDTLSKKTQPAVRLAIASSASSKSFALKTGHLYSITSPIPERNRVLGDDPLISDVRKKPAPDIFLLALKRLNAQMGQDEREVKPEECLVFEDSVAGVEAGRRAGTRVCWVPHQGLREVYRGKEERVLSGKSDGDEIDSPIDERIRDKREKEVGHIRSEDGWAEMRTTLVDFDYARYGLESSRPKVEQDTR